MIGRDNSRDRSTHAHIVQLVRQRWMLASCYLTSCYLGEFSARRDVIMASYYKASCYLGESLSRRVIIKASFYLGKLLSRRVAI